MPLQECIAYSQEDLESFPKIVTWIYFDEKYLFPYKCTADFYLRGEGYFPCKYELTATSP